MGRINISHVRLVILIKIISRNLTNKMMTITSPNILFKRPILGVLIHYRTEAFFSTFLSEINKVKIPWAKINNTNAIRKVSSDLIEYVVTISEGSRWDNSELPFCAKNTVVKAKYVFIAPTINKRTDPISEQISIECFFHFIISMKFLWWNFLFNGINKQPNKL